MEGKGSPRLGLYNKSKHKNHITQIIIVVFTSPEIKHWCICKLQNFTLLNMFSGQSYERFVYINWAKMWRTFSKTDFFSRFCKCLKMYSLFFLSNWGRFNSHDFFFIYLYNSYFSLSLIVSSYGDIKTGIQARIRYRKSLPITQLLTLSLLLRVTHIVWPGSFSLHFVVQPNRFDCLILPGRIDWFVLNKL